MRSFAAGGKLLQVSDHSSIVVTITYGHSNCIQNAGLSHMTSLYCKGPVNDLERSRNKRLSKPSETGFATISFSSVLTQLITIGWGSGEQEAGASVC